MANLTPELLKQLQDYYTQSSSGFSPNVPTNVGGQMYQQNVNQGGYAGEGGDGGSFTPYGYTSYKPGATTGDAWQQYDTKGDFTREGQLKKVGNGDLIAFLTTAASLGMLPGGFLNGGVGGVAGPGEAGWGMDLGVGEGGVFNAAADSQLANLGIEAAGGNPLAGYAGTGGVGSSPVSSGASWWDKLTGALTGGGSGGGSSLIGSAATTAASAAGGNGLLGLGAAALGGLAGGQGQSAENSSTRKMDPRLDQPVFGDLIPRTQQLLAQQMSPERMQGYRAMQQQGMSLLGQPVAGNGFERFYGGR